MTKKDPLDKIMKEREKMLKRMNRTPEEEIKSMALKLFLKVGVGFGSILVAVILFGMTVLYASYNSVLHPEYKTYWPWTLLGGIVFSIFGWKVFSGALAPPEGEMYPGRKFS